MGRREVITAVFLLVFYNGISAQTSFIPPLKIPLSLSANFGELRADHYHSGIDIKTQGVIGKEVVASADGFVYLILVSPVGFGKAIFIRHPNGYSTVYGHLSKYNPEIEEYVKNQQYQSRSYAVTIYPPPARFPVRQGQLIGYSGNTGGSSGPHLHFETRLSNGEKPVNPLMFDFGIEDNLKPMIERLAIYPASERTLINNRSTRIILGVRGSNGNYSLPEGTEISISGTAGFGITGHDLINNASNKFGINALDLIIDSIPWFQYEINQFSFSETRYINAHVDYDAYIRYNYDIDRLFVLPNDKLSLYKGFMNNGLFDFTDGKSHEITIIARDGKNNESRLSFTVKPGQAYAGYQDSNDNTMVMPYGKENTFKSDNATVTIPSGALYDTLYFRYSEAVSGNRFFRKVYKIHNRYTPLQIPYRLSLKPDTVIPGLESKLLIVNISERGTISGVGGSYENGYVSGDVSTFGDYAVSIDTVAPAIRANGLVPGADLSRREELRLWITDNLSGIKSYSGTIDGKWVLFEYDAKNNLIFHRFDSTKTTKGTNHILNVVVSDNKNNVKVLNTDFVW